MKISLYLLVLGFLFTPLARGQNDVYVCTGADGSREYKNTGATKGCRKLDLAGAGLAVPSRISSDDTKPTRQENFSKTGDSARKGLADERKLILQDELRTEESKLASLNRNFNQGEPERNGDERNYARYQERVAGVKEDIARTERNIEALKRELASLR